MSKPTILVTNDDGVYAPGIKKLVEIVSKIGTPIILAPDSPQSGKGHAITLEEPLWVKPTKEFPGLDAFKCSGTPVDCVKLAKSTIFKDRQIDLCVSGINHGSNAAINILYSGTMSAAMEASLEGIPSIGFSYMDVSFEADFTQSGDYILKIIKDVLENNTKKDLLLNVNIPKLKKEEIKGIKICKQGKAMWTEDFRESKDPRGRTYYWMTGAFIDDKPDQDTDIWALQNGYISVVPSMHDLTDYRAMPNLTQLEKITS